MLVDAALCVLLPPNENEGVDVDVALLFRPPKMGLAGDLSSCFMGLPSKGLPVPAVGGDFGGANKGFDAGAAGSAGLLALAPKLKVAGAAEGVVAPEPALLPKRPVV